MQFLTIDEISTIVGMPCPPSGNDRELWLKIAEKLTVEKYGKDTWLASVYFGDLAHVMD